MGRSSRKEVSDREKYWIKLLNSIIPNGYNMTTGGDGGNTLEGWSEEDKRILWAKQGQKRRGHIVSEDTRKKISEAHKGKTMPEEQKIRMSNTLKNSTKPRKSYSKRVSSGMKGKTHSEEARGKISKARLGKTYNEIYTKEKAAEIKEIAKKRFSGKNNPNYFNFTLQLKLKILAYLVKNKSTLKGIRCKFGVSEFIMRKFLRYLKVPNYQSLLYFSDQDWSNLWRNIMVNFIKEQFIEGEDLTEALGIIKWNPPEEFMPANAKGNFPSFIPKTDQERVQNMRRDIEHYQEENMKFEKTEKLDGSSITCYVNGENSGVCSRNLDLKEDIDNTWWKLAIKHDVIAKIKSTGLNLAVQGEIYGSGINGNLYQLDDQRLAVFDIYDIDNGVYLLPEQRWKLVDQLGLPHVPLKGFGTLVGTVSDLLDDADGMSSINPDCIREGYVFKSMTDTNVSFKVISNSYLILKG